MLGFEVSNKRTSNGQNIRGKKVRVSGGHFHWFSTPFFGHHLAALNYATLRTLDTVPLLTPTSLAMSLNDLPIERNLRM